MVILPAQLLLLVGLRTTTGIFYLSILRGVGQPGKGLVLLGLGFILQLALVPIGIRFWGVAGAAAAALARTYLTWPIGCWFREAGHGPSPP